MNKRIQYVDGMEYYSTIKKNEVLPFATMQMGLNGIRLSETSQTEKDRYFILLLICGIWKMRLVNIKTTKKQTHSYREQG